LRQFRALLNPTGQSPLIFSGCYDEQMIRVAVPTEEA
jgi:hypothetical protein